MKYTIKELSAVDLPLAKQLFESWQDTDVSTHSIPSEKYLESLLSQETFHLIVALDSEHVIGGLTAFVIPTYLQEGAEMFLYEIGVDEPYRQKGIARALIEKLKDICTAKGIKIMYVGTEAENYAAQQLYHNTGGVLERVSWFTYDLND